MATSPSAATMRIDGRPYTVAVVSGGVPVGTAEALLDAGFRVVPVSDVESLVDTAPAGLPDLVVVEDGSEGQDLAQSLDRLRSDVRTAYVPIVVAGTNPGRRAAVLRRGADDYLVAPFDREELTARVSGLVRRARTLRAMSPLTALPGNLDIDNALKAALADPGARYAVLYADLDNFKAYNDVHGFAAGDAALQATARVLTHALSRRPGTRNFVGHLGGDDFVLVTDLDNAVPLCRDIIATFDEQLHELEAPPQRAGGRPARGRTVAAPLAISIGVATNARRPLSSVWEISAVATEMKQRAKQVRGSSFAIDHRRGFARADGPAGSSAPVPAVRARGRLVAPQASRARAPRREPGE